jgi:CheY-like chemotaxis protein
MDMRPTVLLAEDEADDVFIMQRVIRKMGLPVSLQVAKDGEEAVEYLSGKGKYADRDLYPLPELILLDIKMPRKTGFDVLWWLKHESSLQQIPAVMVTSSSVKTDVDKAHELGAVAYLVKPVSFDDLKMLFTATEKFLAVHAM